MARHQDWFMMTGDLIINLTNTKSTEMYSSRNFKFKTTPNLMSNHVHNNSQKQCNSWPTSVASDETNGGNGSEVSANSINSSNESKCHYEHKQTQTQSASQLQTNNNCDEPIRQMSLPLVRYSKSDERLIASDKDMTNHSNMSIDSTKAQSSNNSLNTLISERNNGYNGHEQQRLHSCSADVNDDEEELLMSDNSSLVDSLRSQSNSTSSQSATLWPANVSPTKTITTATTTQAEQTESSMSENYSVVSSLSCQTVDQNHHRSQFKVHNNQTLSLSTSSEDSTTQTTPSTSPDDELIKDDESRTLEDVSYRELDDCQTNCRSTQKESKSHSMSSSDEDPSDVESLNSFHYSPPKGVDTPSASRLAKRLYNLEGFKKSDVSRHLSKNNEFNRVVAEEYLKYFDFTGDNLDIALRKFLSRFCLIGETQERERVLVHFSKRYLNCNPESFKSNDAIHTLTCALMLLNTDLHTENVGRKMTCTEFVQNLSGLNEGEDFPRDILRQLFQGIKLSPLEWNADDDDDNTIEDNENKVENIQFASNLNQQISLIGHNPFLEVPNPNCAIEYKKGYIMRKCCYESNGKRTPIGKRGWKMFHSTLRDLVLYLHKDEHGFRKNQLYESLNNSIRVHHSLASNANDYAKKQFVFRLITADHAEYLFQTSDAHELQSWIDTINSVAASLSSPQLPGGVGSNPKKFQRPLLPVSHTKLNLHDQLNDHENRVLRLETELEDHLAKAPEKGTLKRIMNEFAEKESYLKHELKRYRTYVSILRVKLSQYAINNSMASMVTQACSQPLHKVAIGEETSDDSNDAPIIITVKRSYSSDR